MTKKIISVTLALLILISTMVSYAAAYSEMEEKEYMESLLESTSTSDKAKYVELIRARGGTTFSYSINMYDYFTEQYNKLSQEFMVASNAEEIYSPEEVDYILNYKARLTERVEYLNSLTDEQLDLLNCTEEQKYAIRNFDGSDMMLRSAASGLVVDGGFDPFEYPKSGGTKTRLVVYFYWNGGYTPGSLFSNEDIMGASWDSPFQADTENTIITLGYVNAKKNSTFNKSGEVIECGKYANGFLIPNNELKFIDDIPIGHWISDGFMNVPLSTRTKQVEATGFTAYGYNTISATPSIGVGSDGNVTVGFSFSKKVSVVHPKRFYFPD